LSIDSCCQSWHTVMYPAAMPTRRIFLMALGVVVLATPAKSVVRHWGRMQLARPEGTFRHSVGEVLVTIT